MGKFNIQLTAGVPKEVVNLFDSNFPNNEASIGAIGRRLSYLLFNLADITRERCLCYCITTDQSLDIFFYTDEETTASLSMGVHGAAQGSRFIQFLLKEEQRKWFNKSNVVDAHVSFTTNKGEFDYTLNVTETEIATRLLLTVEPGKLDVSQRIFRSVKKCLGCKSKPVEVESFNIVSYAQGENL